MPTSPGPLKWAKWLVRENSLAMLAFEQFFSYGTVAALSSSVGWRRLHAVCTRLTPAGTIEDKAIMTFDLLNITSGSADDTWTTTDFTTAESKFDTMFAAIASGLSPKLTVSEYRWYRKTFAPAGTVYPDGKPKYFADSGPPARVTPKAIVGTGPGTQQMPYQVAISVTEKTSLAKHWGRFYIPNPGMSMFDAFGRVAATTFVQTPVQVCYAALADAELFPVVPSGAHSSLLSVTQIQVDDVPDVQRSRRPKTTLVRTVGP